MDMESTVFDVILEGTRPYGFRVTGGKDVKMPLRIGVVRDGSKASNANLQAGLHILSINGQSTSEMTQRMAKNAVKASTGRLGLTLRGKRSFILMSPPLPSKDFVRMDRPPAPLPESAFTVADEMDSGYSLTPSITSSVTDRESITMTDPILDAESDPEIDSITEIPPPLPPAPPQPPVNDNDTNDILGSPEIEGDNIQDAKQSGLSCGGCGRAVKSKDMFVKIDSISWHVGCLNCKECEEPLFNKDYSVKHGQPVCLNHVH